MHIHVRLEQSSSTPSKNELSDATPKWTETDHTKPRFLVSVYSVGEGLLSSWNFDPFIFQFLNIDMENPPPVVHFSGIPINNEIARGYFKPTQHDEWSTRIHQRWLFSIQAIYIHLSAFAQINGVGWVGWGPLCSLLAGDVLVSSHQITSGNQTWPREIR